MRSGPTRPVLIASLLALGFGSAAAGCQKQDKPAPAAKAESKPGKAVAKADAKKPKETADAKKADGAKGDAKDAERGRLETTLLPLADMLGAKPPEVEAHLGPHKTKGGTRKSCVRFVPDRVWFSCDAAWQRYEDKNGKLSGVRVWYEDGIATAVGLESIPGEGTFDPKKALELAGVFLPGEPRMHQPKDDVRIWAWFNDRARLKVKGREYKVEVSVIGEDWYTAKVEIILNDRLNDDEKARVIPAKAKNDAKAPGTPPAG